MITKETAHKVGLELLANTEQVEKLKEIVKEKVLGGEKVTRLVIDESDKENAVSDFGIVRDGDDLAITFERSTGDKALRPFDDEALAEMLNKMEG
jgi:hypothetical protein